MRPPAAGPFRPRASHERGAGRRHGRAPSHRPLWLQDRSPRPRGQGTRPCPAVPGARGLGRERQRPISRRGAASAGAACTDGLADTARADGRRHGRLTRVRPPPPNGGGRTRRTGSGRRHRADAIAPFRQKSGRAGTGGRLPGEGPHGPPPPGSGGPSVPVGWRHPGPLARRLPAVPARAGCRARSAASARASRARRRTGEGRDGGCRSPRMNRRRARPGSQPSAARSSRAEAIAPVFQSAADSVCGPTSEADTPSNR